MQVQLPDDTKQLSIAAGFANVDQFVNSLLQKERERLAIQAVIDAMDAGQVTDFADFDREFREKNELKARHSAGVRVVGKEPICGPSGELVRANLRGDRNTSKHARTLPTCSGIRIISRGSASTPVWHRIPSNASNRILFR